MTSGERDVHDRVQDQATDWVLAAIDPPDRAHFDAHLGECAECTAYVADLQRIGEAIGTASLETPPAGLRERVLAAAAADDDAATRGGALSAPIAAVGGGSRAGGSGDELSRRRSRRVAVAGWLVAAAAVILLGFSIGWGLSLRSDRETAQTQQAQLHGALTSMPPGTYQVATIEGESGAVATTFVRSDAAMVMPASLEVNDARSSIYVLWSMASPADGTPVALGSFDVAPNQPMASVAMTGHAEAGTWFAISFEQGRTVPSAPTTVLGAGNAA